MDAFGVDRQMLLAVLHSSCDSEVSSSAPEEEVAAVDAATEDTAVGAPAVFAEIDDVTMLELVCCSSSVLGFVESAVDFAGFVVFGFAGVVDAISPSLGWPNWCPLPQTLCLSTGIGLPPLGFCPPRDGVGLKKKTIVVVIVVVLVVVLI